MHARGREILLRSRVEMGGRMSLVEGAERKEQLTNVPIQPRIVAGGSGGHRWRAVRRGLRCSTGRSGSTEIDDPTGQFYNPLSVLGQIPMQIRAHFRDQEEILPPPWVSDTLQTQRGGRHLIPYIWN